MEYIKELRLCIRNYQSTESTLLSDKGALQLEVTEQQKSHMETGLKTWPFSEFPMIKSQEFSRNKGNGIVGFLV